MRKIDVAIIGLGGMGKTNIRSLKGVDFISTIKGVDLREEPCRQVKKEFGISTYTDVKEVWDDPCIELVYITTPNKFHAELVIQALKAGKKVMTEKPMGITPEETQKIIETVKQTKGFLQVGFECRNYSKLYVMIKEIIDSGEIGTPKHISFSYVLPAFPNEGPSSIWKFSKDSAGGMFQEKLCHYIDLPRWWMGEKVIRFFCSKASNTIPYYQIPDNMECTYQFESGCVSHLTFMMGPAHGDNYDLLRKVDIYDQRDQGYKLDYYIVGTEGAVEASVFHRELRVFHHTGKPGVNYSSMVRVETWKPEEDHFYFHNTTDQNIDIARRVSEGLGPAIEPEDAAETMRLCYEFETAAQQTWKVIER